MFVWNTSYKFICDCLEFKLSDWSISFQTIPIGNLKIQLKYKDLYRIPSYQKLFNALYYYIANKITNFFVLFTMNHKFLAYKEKFCFFFKSSLLRLQATHHKPRLPFMKQEEEKLASIQSKIMCEEEKFIIRVCVLES